ncbi:hypothetical protein DL765_006370 [Monosporascus sp. GIB2]|nr:hypothetical protein DL765_006370 [Monosporascus sp. GIB2]
MLTLPTAAYEYYESGTAASNAVKTDASVSAKFMAVSGSASIHHSIAQSFNSSMQYSMFSFSHAMAHVGFDGWDSDINSDVLKQRLASIASFCPSNPDPVIVAAYANLFGNLGSHIITGLNFGARFQLHIRCENSDSSVNQSFHANLSFAFKGLATGGRIDVSVAGTDQYKSFSNKMQKICCCVGGDATLATAIISGATGDDDVYQKFREWVKTHQQHPSIISIQTVALWDVMSTSPDPEVSRRSRDVENAYLWIVSHPRRHRTKCRLTINSDWGEIGLLTPSAFILSDPDSPVQHPNVSISSTKIRWDGKPAGYGHQHLAIDFIIENDGSPVDIELARGNDGDRRGVPNGSCEVMINNRRYINRGARGGGRNSEWFYKCEVNPDAWTIGL